MIYRSTAVFREQHRKRTLFGNLADVKSSRLVNAGRDRRSPFDDDRQHHPSLRNTSSASLERPGGPLTRGEYLDSLLLTAYFLKCVRCFFGISTVCFGVTPKQNSLFRRNSEPWSFWEYGDLGINIISIPASLQNSEQGRRFDEHLQNSVSTHEVLQNIVFVWALFRYHFRLA